MKNKNIVTVCLLIVLLIVLVCGFTMKLVSNGSKQTIYIGTFIDSKEIGYNHVFTDYNEYRKYFDSEEVTRKDFEKNNYVLVEVFYDSCSEYNIDLKDYSIDKEDINVLITYTARCGVCRGSYMYYLLQVDKSVVNVNLNIDYKATNEVMCDPDVAYKPIIYLYPQNTMDVTVRLKNDSYLTTTYPKYEKEWVVSANKNGILIDRKTGRELYGLYWEGNNHKAKVEKDGFVVRGEDTINFLEEKLSILGLNAREANEFIIYWLPKLEKNKYNYIRFETIEEINNYMPLDIDPKPDTIIRVLMDYKPLENKIDVEEQILQTPKREGFTVVEWGGSLIK